MGRSCDMCGKGTGVGNKIVRHGMAKKKGGIGLHTTGVTRRRFLANLQRVKIRTPEGTVKRSWVCASCIKSGRVTKA